MFAGTTNAAETTVRYQGTITFVKSAVLNDVSTSDSLSLTVVYDSNLVAPSGSSSVVFGTPAAPSLQLNIGSLSFTESQDLDFGNGFPNMAFEDGTATALNMVVLDGIDDPPSDLDARSNNITLSNSVDGTVLTAVIDFQSPLVLPSRTRSVPMMPPFGLALLLFAIGIFVYPRVSKR